MINVYMCEDNKEQLVHLSEMLGQYLKYKKIDGKIISSCQDPLEILEDVKQNGDNAALFFIDVELENYKIDGFELAKKVKDQNDDFMIVFLTAKEELAYRTFEDRLEVLDYIIKRPAFFLKMGLDKELEKRLDAIFEKIFCRMSLCEKESLTVKCGSRTIIQPLDQIRCIRTVNNEHFVEIVSEDRVIRTNETMKKIYERLNEKFVYVSRAAIVNVEKIKEINWKERFIYLDIGIIVEISFRERKKLIKYMSEGEEIL